jgi:hypothetical protein
MSRNDSEGLPTLADRQRDWVLELVADVGARRRTPLWSSRWSLDVIGGRTVGRCWSARWSGSSVAMALGLATGCCVVVIAARSQPGETDHTQTHETSESWRHPVILTWQ